MLRVRQPFPNGVIFPDALNGRKEKDKIKTKKTKRRENSQTIHYVQIVREKNERK